MPLLLLVFNLGVILFGAYVRMSGSGAGCGSHWPSCNGELVPHAPQAHTVIEFTHRLTSGLSLALAIGAVVWSHVKFAAGHRARKAALGVLAFIILEALVGAGIVIFGLVEKNDSVARAIVVAFHLVNTLGLLASAMLLFLSVAHPGQLVWPKYGALLLIAGVIVALTSASGAITALGDTLFPVNTALPVAERVVSDLRPVEHFLVRLRIVHPIVAATSATYLLFVGAWFFAKAEKAALALMALVILQVIAGLVNIALAAPDAMQLTHLFLADCVWLALVATAFNASRAT
jgi:heme A synthase